MQHLTDWVSYSANIKDEDGVVVIFDQEVEVELSILTSGRKGNVEEIEVLAMRDLYTKRELRQDDKNSIAREIYRVMESLIVVDWEFAENTLREMGR